MPDPAAFPVDVFGAALIVGLLGLPAILLFHIGNRQEMERGRPQFWHIAMILLLCSFPAATMFLPGVPRFFLVLGVMILGVFGGAFWSFYGMKFAPKVYWFLRYAIWKLTGLWPNR